MYAYFGGAAVFSEVIVWTGCLQLVVGIIGELFVLWEVIGGGRCGDVEALWAHWVGLGLLCGYAVLFAGDVVARGKEGRKEE